MGRALRFALPALLTTLALAPTGGANVCASASGCEFWDNDHHEYLLYTVDTGQVDVLIVPPASAQALWDLPAIQQGIQAWEDGINALGPAWLANGLDIHAYVLGLDTAIPQSALTDPEIIIWSATYNPVLLFGIGEQVPVSVCRTPESAAHMHSGVSVQQFACADGGAQCHVINTNFLTGTTRNMYDLNAHEFGHCLGIGHVGDAGDFDAKTVPLTDIMSYNDVPSQVHCVSTLNILALVKTYEPVLGVGPGQAAGTYVTAPASAYGQVTCANPADGLWI